MPFFFSHFNNNRFEDKNELCTAHLPRSKVGELGDPCTGYTCMSCIQCYEAGELRSPVTGYMYCIGLQCNII